MLRAFNDTLALLFAHKAGFFKILSRNDALSETELSEQMCIPQRSTSALISLFVAQVPPLVKKDENGKISLATEARTYLVPDSPLFMGGLIDFINENPDTFQPDVFAKQMREDKPHRPMFIEDKTFNQQMVAAMNGKSTGPASIWAEKLDLSNYKHFLDIGGGSGIFSKNLLKSHPHLKATVFELPYIVEVTQEFVKGTAVETVNGSFFEDDYPVADIHFYSDIFHDYAENDCIMLATKSFKFLPKNGRIILHELPFNDSKTEPLSTAVYNFSVIRWTHGRQYSQNELIRFLKNAGFSQIESIATGYLDWMLVTGIKL